jgi:YD repeat-containing protein
MCILKNNPARQDLVYKYDASGNITAISDVSATTSPKTTVYAYDTLSRLTSVGTTSGTVSCSKGRGMGQEWGQGQ